MGTAMRRRALCVVGLAILALAACAPREAGLPKAGFVPALYLSGDVDHALRIDRAAAADFEWTTINNDGNRLPAISLAELVRAAAPRATDYELLLVGSDALASKIDGADLGGCFVAFSDAYAWECINFNHPISSRVKMLQRVILATKEGVPDPHALGIVRDGRTETVTAGQLHMKPLMEVRRFEGRSEINGRYVEVYTPHLYASTMGVETDTALVVGYDGSTRYVHMDSGAESAIEVGHNALNYSEHGKPVVEDIAGLMADPPRLSIASAYEDAVHFLDAGESVLIVELDGWGWNMYERAKAAGKQEALARFEATRALAAYPPISPVGLATLLTGVQPDAHGIHDRDNKQLLVPDLFERAAGMGKKAAYIEGDAALIQTSLAPSLSPDIGGLPGTDDEVHAKAMAAARAGVDLAFVHFHGIDDEATTHGPYAEPTLERISRIDGYVSELMEAWSGRVIVTADHGLHEVAQGGAHGVFCAEDMGVPYIITRGGAAR